MAITHKKLNPVLEIIRKRIKNKSDNIIMALLESMIHLVSMKSKSQLDRNQIKLKMVQKKRRQ